MELRQLRYFVAAAKYSNFTDAAKHLFITQPALSLQIAELEKELGVQLFVRKGRSVHLSPVGRVFWEEANAVLSRSEQAVQVARQASKGINGSFRVGFLSSPARSILPQITASFHAKHPNIALQLERYTYSALTQALENGTVDFGLMTAFNPSVLATKELMFHKLYTVEMCVLMHRKHALSHHPKIDLRDLANESFVFLARDQNPELFDDGIHLLASRGVSPNIVAQPLRMEEVVLFAESGIGISIAPRYVESYQISPHLCLVEIEGTKSYDVVAAWKKNNGNPLIASFIEELDAVDFPRLCSARIPPH
jgi:DNA-binding transcriptional LysR family regulator